jgi:hypothetical protein
LNVATSSAPDRLDLQVRDARLVGHRRQHLGVVVREDVGRVAGLAQPGDTLGHVLEDVEFVADGQDLVASVRRDVRPVGRQGVLEGVAVQFDERLVGVDVVATIA